MSWDAWANVDINAKPAEDPTWGDYGKAFAGGAAGVAAGASGLARQYFEAGNSPNAAAVFKELQGAARRGGEDIQESMTEEGRERLNASILSEEFLSHPISNLALKVTNMAPNVIGAAVPGMVMRSVMASVLAGGGLSAGDVTEEIYAQTDKLTDEQLKKESKLYRGLIADGMDPKDARDEMNRVMLGAKPALAFMFGAATGAFGGVGHVVRGFEAGGAKGAARVAAMQAEAKAAGEAGKQGILRTAGEGALTEAGEETYGAVAAQKAAIEGGLKEEYDLGEALARGVTGGVLGGLLGGGAAAITGGKGKAKADEIKAARAREEGADVQAETGEAGVAVQAEAAPATRSQAAKAASKQGVTIVDAGSVAPDEALALGSAAQPVATSATAAAEAATNAAAASVPPPQPPVQPSPVAQVAPPVPDVGQQLPAGQPGAVAPQQAQPVPPAQVPAAAPAPVTPEVTPSAGVSQQAQQGAGNQQVLQAAAPSQVATPPLGEINVNTPQAAAPEQGATAPPFPTQTIPPIPSAVGEAVTAPTPAQELTKKPVLRDVSEEGAKKAAATTEAAQKTAKGVAAVEKAVAKEEAEFEKPPKGRNLKGTHKAAQEARNAKAAIMFREYTGTDEKLEVPKDKAARIALAQKLKPLVDDIFSQIPDRKALLAKAEKAHVKHYWQPPKGYTGPELAKPSEDEHLEYHGSLPGRVGGDKPTSSPAVVQFMRELVDLQSILASGKSPDKFQKLRIENLVTSFNQKAPELVVMSRKEASQRLAMQHRGGNAEQAQATQEARDAGQATPGAVVQSPVSEGAAGPGKKIEGEEFARKAREIEERLGLKPKAAEVVAKAQVKEEPVTRSETERVTLPTAEETEGKPEPKPEPKAPEPETKAEEVTEGEVTPEVTEAGPTTSIRREELTPAERIKALAADKAMKLRLERAAAAKKAQEAREAALPKTAEAKKAAVAGGLKPRSSLVEQSSSLEAPRIVKVSTGEEATPLYSMKVSEAINALDFEHMQGVSRALAPFMRKMLKDLVGNTNLHVISDKDMARVASDRAGKLQPETKGFWYRVHTIEGRKQTEEGHYIVIRESEMGDPAAAAHAIVHEAVHDVANRALERDAGMRNAVFHMMRITRDFAKGNIEHELASSYALTNAGEFVAEAFSNKDFQALLAQIPADEKLVRGLKLTEGRTSVWDAMIAAVRGAIEKALRRKIPNGHSMMEAALRIGDYAAESRAKTITPQRGLLELQNMIRTERAKLGGTSAELSLTEAREAVLSRTDDAQINVSGSAKRARDYVSRLWDMSQINQHIYGPSNPLNRLFDLRAMMERAKGKNLDTYGGKNAAAQLAEMERKHPELMTKAKDIWFDASLHDVNLKGDNGHLGKDKLMGVQAKNEIDRLQKAWANPALNPVRKAMEDAGKFFKDIHNAVSRETINNILAEANIHDKALAERIHNDGLTEADRVNFANTKLVDALDQVRALKRRQGSFIPFRRYGEFISAAEHELSVPANATKINDNTLQFIDPRPKNGQYGNARARAQVKIYLRSNSHTPQGNKLAPAQIRQVWVDSTNPSQIVEAEDTNAIPAYRVSMQTQHVEMHETEAEAKNSQAALKEAGLTNSRTHKREEVYRTDVTNIQSAMGTVLRSLEKQQRYIDADATQKAAMREMFHDLSIGLSGTTSIKNSMRQRRNVAGMSHDLARVTGDYGQVTANHLAMLQYRPKFDAVFKEMRDYNDARPDDKDRIRREEIYQEFLDRIYGKAAKQAEAHKGGMFNTVVTRLLQTTRLSRLAGVSFHLINMHEPFLTSLPVIGGNHGMIATARSLMDSYNMIGGRAALVAGLSDTAKAYTSDTGFTDYVKVFKDAIGKSKVIGSDKAKRLMDLLDYADDRNLFSDASIFEQAKFANAEGNIVGRALDRADLMANQVGSAIEAINRTVTLKTAYELEYKSNGGNHEAAMHYAFSTAQDTMGDYSNWNAAPVFNTALGRPAFQFKKFGQKTYMLLGRLMGGVMKGDPQAMKQFAGLMVTHGLVAGALGMPTEPFKIALMAANMVGATGFTPEDYEYAVRQLAARLAGQKGGEIISKGLYRGIGIEVAGRMGYDSLITGLTPKGQKIQDTKAYLFDTVAGAPASYLLDQIAAAQAAFKGDWSTAIEKSSPLRIVGDVAKAAVGAAGPKLGPTGKPTQEQFNMWETGVRALGFTPSSAAEMGALRGTVARESRRLGVERSELIQEWLDATGSGKVAAQRAVQAFNAGRPREQQITQENLRSAATRRETELAKTKHGVTTTKRTKDIQERAESVFNP